MMSKVSGKLTLNPAQEDAVFHTEGPLLVVAGAGAGKTRVITERIARLIESGVPPEEILAVTFTNKAASEMRDRITCFFDRKTGLIYPITFPFVGTFHSLGVKILRERGHVIGIKRRFLIKDKEDSRSLIKHAMRDLEYDIDEFDPRRIQENISRAKGLLKTENVYREENMGDFFPGVVFSVWERYEALLKKESALDFDDLLLKTILLLRKSAETLLFYQKKWRYLHVDEYQDTNHAQYMLSKLLAENHKNICVVGDADQSIYGWRGARVKNMLHFEKDYPKTKIVFLEENYRSTKTILNAADSVIKKNTFRIPKNLFTENPSGDKISFFPAISGGEEASHVAEVSKMLISKGVSPDSIAVLYRTNFQSRALEEAFLSTGVPYQVLGTRFFERKEVKDTLSYIQAGENNESLSDIKRIINTPPRGIGKVTIAKLFAGKGKNLPRKTQDKLDEFYALLSRVHDFSSNHTPSEIIKFILKESGMEEQFKKDGEDGMERLQNIKELVTLASRYDTLPREEALLKFLEDAALQTDQDTLLKEISGVKLMTIHAAKGLEFPHVFVTGLEQGLFPQERHGNNNDNYDNNVGDNKEEERRLFYVALTRAEKKIYLSYAETRIIFGSLQLNMPSEFLRDIPEELLELDVSPESEAGEIEYD